MGGRKPRLLCEFDVLLEPDLLEALLDPTPLPDLLDVLLELDKVVSVSDRKRERMPSVLRLLLEIDLLPVLLDVLPVLLDFEPEPLPLLLLLPFPLLPLDEPEP
jgi:hypothetical protein